MQKMTKRGIGDQNYGRQKKNIKKAPQNKGAAAPPFPVASAAPLPNHEIFSPSLGI